MMQNEDDTPTITLTIMVGSGGGFVVYDVTERSRLAFGGNLDETTSYLHSVMDNLRAVGPEPDPVPTTVSPAVAYKPATFRKTPVRALGDAPRPIGDILNEEH